MSSFVRIVEPPYTWKVPRAELDYARRILPILSNMEDKKSHVMTIKETPHKSVYRFPGPYSNTAVYVKIYRRDSWRYLLRTPPGTREARIMMKLQQARVPVSDLVAVGVERHFPFEIENLLVVRSAANLWTLGRWCLCEFREHGKEARRCVTPVLMKVLAAVRRMHDAGVFHGDLNPGNILIDPDGEKFLFIDFHRSRSLWTQQGRLRVWDVCKVLSYYDKYYNPSELIDLACAYAPGSGLLSRTIRGLWEETGRRIRQRWVNHILDQCCDSRTYFQQVKLEPTILYIDRGYAPAAVLEFISEASSAGEWRCDELAGTGEEARERWREAVRESMIGEISETPVALVCRPPQDGGNCLIWDPQRQPRYRVSYIFSAERFDPSSDDLSKTRGI